MHLAIPIAVISSGIMIALILTGVRTPGEAFSGFINTNVVMFVAMFVIGAGLTKTKLIDHAQNLVIRYKENPRMLIFYPVWQHLLWRVSQMQQQLLQL